jgi:branched-chain amino acid aminotransferase
VDARIIGSGQPGPITKQIQAAYFAAVKGENVRYEHWLTYI